MAQTRVPWWCVVLAVCAFGALLSVALGAGESAQSGGAQDPAGFVRQIEQSLRG